MKPEQQRIKIAEACGWKRVAPMAEVLWGASATKDKLWMWPHQLPNYLTDLNAMYEAEKVIIERGLMHPFEGYHNTLCGILDNGNAIHATAAQRAEAFLRTLNLWTY